MLQTVQALKLPKWLTWLALAGGVFLGAAALAYTPQGRINLLWLWWLWAGLPFLGSLLALGSFLLPTQPLWLKSTLKLSPYWQPLPHQRWWLLEQINRLWIFLALGMLLVFLLLLLFSDLAFGWSSTLISQPQVVVEITQVISLPWQFFWPQAVPDLQLIEQTRFARIEAAAGNFQEASRWWPFLLANLLFYNLLPRVALTLFCSWRSRQLQPLCVEIQATKTHEIPTQSPTAAPQQPAVDQWQTAVKIGWQLGETAATPAQSLNLGDGDWQEEEDLWQAWLQTPSQHLVWLVVAQQPPLDELADKIKQAATAGCYQALQLVSQGDIEERHLMSWQAFARKNQLVWLEDAA